MWRELQIVLLIKADFALGTMPKMVNKIWLKWIKSLVQQSATAMNVSKSFVSLKSPTFIVLFVSIL